MAVAGKWSELKGVQLHDSLVRALTNVFGFPTMTPVQAAAIPPLLSSQDVCVDAETGSGKTLSFLVPIAQTLLFGRESLRSPRPSPYTRALIILPTRELARQVHSVACALFSGLPGSVQPCAVIGGEVVQSDVLTCVEDLRVVIATPGRLNAELVAGNLRMRTLEMLVLDEADRLLDMGFDVTLTSIFSRLPKQRRTGLYSATQNEGVESLARAGMRNPVRVAVAVRSVRKLEQSANQRTPLSLRAHYQLIRQNDKLSALCALLASRQHEKIIVYFLTCASVHFHALLPLQKLIEQAALRSSVDKNMIKVRNFLTLHGKMAQQKRNKNLRLFTESTNAVLFCTDVAARGIDLPDVDAVVQFDIPQDPDVYVHRVGRTARLGRTGYSLIFLAPEEEAYIEFLRARNCPILNITSGDEMVGEVASATGLFSVDLDAVEDGTENANEFLEQVRQDTSQVIRKCILEDRAVLDASEKAFLSYLRGYKEHKCRYILRLDSLDITSTANAFHLLRIPKFHEFKKLGSRLNFKRNENIRIRNISFKNTTQEDKRQAIIKAAELARKNTAKKRNRTVDKAKNRKVKAGKRRSRDGSESDQEDFRKAAQLLKKAKRGKMPRADVDELLDADLVGDSLVTRKRKTR